MILAMVMLLSSSTLYFASAEEEHDAYYYYALGRREENEKNYKVALENYLTASEMGDTDAMRRVGLLYENGYGVDQDAVKHWNGIRKLRQKVVQRV